MPTPCSSVQPVAVDLFGVDAIYGWDAVARGVAFALGGYTRSVSAPLAKVTNG